MVEGVGLPMKPPDDGIQFHGRPCAETVKPFQKLIGGLPVSVLG